MSPKISKETKFTGFLRVLIYLAIIILDPIYVSVELMALKYVYGKSLTWGSFLCSLLRHTNNTANKNIELYRFKHSGRRKIIYFDMKLYD